MHLELHTTIVQALCSCALFLFLWFVLGRVIFRPFFALLEEREARTTGAEAGAAEKREEAARLRAKLAELERELRLQGIAARDVIVQGAKKRGQELGAEADRAAMDQLNRAKEEIKVLRRTAQGELAREIERVASLLMESAVTIRGTKGTESRTIH